MNTIHYRIDSKLNNKKYTYTAICGKKNKIKSNFTTNSEQVTCLRCRKNIDKQEDIQEQLFIKMNREGI